MGNEAAFTFICIILPELSVNGNLPMLPDKCGHSWPYETKL